MITLIIFFVWKIKYLFYFLKIINAVLDIDHLILNVVNAFKEQHFSLETAKLSGQLHVLLIINPSQYTIEANLQQLRIDPVNIIDSKNVKKNLLFVFQIYYVHFFCPWRVYYQAKNNLLLNYSTKLLIERQFDVRFVCPIVKRRKTSVHFTIPPSNLIKNQAKQ